MDDLRVENYDEKEVEAKKQAILKRVARTGCVVVVGGVVAAALGLFLGSLFAGVGGSGSWFISTLEEA